MRAATAVWATGILLLLTEVRACAAGAEDAIKLGKWEFWDRGVNDAGAAVGNTASVFGAVGSYERVHHRGHPKIPAFPLAVVYATARGPFC
jgi:hypothetical protein